MFSQIIWGIIFIGSGVVLVLYARKFVEWFGMMDFAEKFFGSGGTYTALRIFGILAIIIGILVATGFMDNALMGIIKFVGVK